MARRRSAKKRGWPDNLYESGGYYYYRNPETGKKKGIGRDKSDAFAEARAANNVLAERQGSRLVEWVSGVEVMTLEKWLPTYLDLWQEHTNPAKSTLEMAKQFARRMAKIEFAAKPMNLVTTAEIAAYLDELEEHNGICAAINMRARLQDVFNYAATKGHIETGRNPVSATLPPRYKPKRDRLSLPQFLAVRDKAAADGPAWLVNAMNLALLTAQRVSDISEMKFDDIKDGHLEVSQIKMQGAVKLKIDIEIRLEAIGMSIADAIKQCRDRIVSKHLVHQVRTSGTYRAGEKVQSDGISKVFSEIRNELGIVAGSTDKTPPTFHEIRSLAKRLYTKEYGKEFSQNLCGHKTEWTAAKYEDPRGGWQMVERR